MLTGISSLAGFGPIAGGPEGEAGGLMPYVPDQLLMRFTAGTSDTLRNQILTQEGASIIKEYQTVDVVLVDLPDYQADVIGASDYWSSKPEVLYAEPNWTIQPLQVIPDDPRFPDLYGMNNTGQTGGTADADIDAPEAWEIYTGTSATVVAVIDTGVDYTHQDLVDNMWVNPGEIAGNGIDDDGNGYIDDIYGIDTANGDSDPMDDVDHGTHVAGHHRSQGEQRDRRYGRQLGRPADGDQVPRHGGRNDCRCD